MLKRLDLINFRNYNKYSLDLAKTTILIGPNGIGKTNILEAVSLISTGRSWRTNKDNETVKWDEEVARIVGELKNESIHNSELNNSIIKLEMVIQKIPSLKYPMTKIVKINEVKHKLTDILGKLPTVLFSPEEINMAAGAPQLRRRFLDIMLCQLDKKYTLALLDLAKVIRGRNKLLYFIKIGKSQEKELDFWDEKLVTLGTFIISKRQKAIDEMNKDLSKIYQEIAGQTETLQMKYRSSVDIDNFAEMLIANRAREIDSTATLFGPHRDDLIFMLDGRDVTTFGSRGELRSVILAAKVSELEYIAKKVGERPLLLLDDIFSELDATRRLHLVKIIADQQTIITTTDLDHIEKSLREKAKIVELE